MNGSSKGFVGCEYMEAPVQRSPVMIVCAVPGFLLWILPYFCYQKLKRDKAAQVTPIIGQKQDEIYSVCEQASRLLQA